MKADKLFLKNLESSLVVLHSEDKLKIRFVKFGKRFVHFPEMFRESVMETINQASDYLKTRENFWSQID